MPWERSLLLLPPCAKLFPCCGFRYQLRAMRRTLSHTSQMPFSCIPLRWSFRNYMVTRRGKISQSRISHQWKLSCGKKIGKIRRAVRVGNFPCPPHQISCCKNETVAQKGREVERAFQYLLSKKIP